MIRAAAPGCAEPTWIAVLAACASMEWARSLDARRAWISKLFGASAQLGEPVMEHVKASRGIPAEDPATRSALAGAELYLVASLLGVVERANTFDARHEARSGLVGALTDAFARFRTLGDGFAGAVNALRIAARQRPTQEWSNEACQAFREVLVELAISPRLDFDAAMDLMDRLEAAGFAPSSQSLDALVDALAPLLDEGRDDDHDR